MEQHSVHEVICLVAQQFAVDPDVLITKRRCGYDGSVVRARHAAALMLRHADPTIGTGRIGQALGYVGGESVRKALQSGEELAFVDAGFREKVDALCRALGLKEYLPYQ